MSTAYEVMHAEENGTFSMTDGNSVVVALPDLVDTAVVVAPASAATLYTQVYSTWVAWDDGSVTADTAALIESPVKAIKVTASGGSATVEVSCGRHCSC